MRKLSAKWLPCLLTADHKRASVVASKQCLGMFQRNSKEFLRHYVTVDETRMHYYTPETKNYLIYATKYFLIHLITQIWLLAIIFCFLT